MKKNWWSIGAKPKAGELGESRERVDTVWIHLPASTTIGIASEVLRLALARCVLLAESMLLIRVALPRLKNRGVYPSAIYRVLEAPRLMHGRSWKNLHARFAAFIAQFVQTIRVRSGLFLRSVPFVPNGQEGIYVDSPDLLRRALGEGSRFGALRRVARAVRGFGPVTLNEDAMRRCAIDLAAMGIGPDDWFVCLHVRTSAFHKDHADYRNGRFDHCSLAIDHIIDLGGKVVRMGDTGAGIVTCPRTGLIDYPNTRWKSELMDLYLIKQCRFYIGTQSGILDTSYLLQTPTLCVNSVHFDMRSPNPCDRVLYKRIQRKGESRPLSIAEALDSYHDILATDWYRRYEFLENSGAEILAAVQEFISVIDGERRATQRQVRMRRRLIRERLKHTADHGGARSMLAASIAFSRCHVVDFSLTGIERI